MVTLGEHGRYLSVDLVCTHEDLIGGLTCFADESRQLLLEGTSNEVAKVLASISERPVSQAASGYISLRRPKFIGIQMTDEKLGALLRTLQKFAGPDVFIHCVVIAKDEVLLEAYDAGSGEILLSPLLPMAQINNFARLMKVTVSERTVS